MPQIQVLGREALEDRDSLAQQSLKRQELAQKSVEMFNDIKHKKALLDYQLKTLAVQKQMADTEQEKISAATKESQFKKLAVVLGAAQQFKKGDQFDVDGYSKYASAVLMNDQDLLGLFKDESFMKSIGGMQPSADEQQAIGAGRKYGAEADFMNAAANAIRGNGTGGGAGESGGFIVPEATINGVKMVNPARAAQVKSAETLAAGLPPDKAGLKKLAEESVQNIEDIKKLMFDLDDKGRIKGFHRGVAFGSNLPGPGTVLPFAKDSQTVFRKMGSALAARQLIQTGVAAREDEKKDLIAQFAPNFFSNPRAALDGLNQLQHFYQNYIKTLKTRDLPGAPESTGNFTIEAVE